MSYPRKYIVPKGTTTPNLGNINSNLLQSVYKQNIVECGKIGNIGKSSTTNGNTGPIGGGNIGEIGSTGPTKNGPTGVIGPKGIYGNNGTNGSNGITGSTGPNGLDYDIIFYEIDYSNINLFTTYFDNININWCNVASIGFTNIGFYMITAKFTITDVSNVPDMVDPFVGLQLGISKNPGNTDNSAGPTGNIYSEIGGSMGQIQCTTINDNKKHFFCYECSGLYEVTTPITLYLNLYNTNPNDYFHYSINEDTFSFVAHNINRLS